MAEIRFSHIRSALRTLDMKHHIAARAIGIPYAEFRRAERADTIIPAKYLESAERLIDLAGRVSSAKAVRSGVFHRPFTATFSFSRPRCHGCRCALHSVGTKRTVQRGEFWYFRCPKCGQRFWSKDGRANPVNPKGGNWRDLKDRIRCPDCKVECRVAASPSKRSKSRFWECPKCGKRYRNLRGRAVATRPGGRANVELSFLPSRKCPSCATEHLFIKARPRPPVVKAYYFGCSHCGSSFRWNPELKRLIRLRRRKAYTRSKSDGGRPSGMDRGNEQKTREILALAIKRAEEREATGDALRSACLVAYAGEDQIAALDRARKNVRKFLRLFGKDSLTIKWNETLKRFPSRKRTAN